VDGVYTNNPPGGAFRGFGAPQAALVAEIQMDKLAQALDMDPVELRLRNLLRENSLMATGVPLRGGAHLVEVTQACARAAGWKEAGDHWIKPQLQPSHPSRLVGTGLAVAAKNVGFSYGYQENCWAKIELRGGANIDQALVYIGSAEVGQVTHTAIRMMAAEALELPVDKVRMVASDTATSPGSAGSVSASRMTYMSGNAIRGAAQAAMEKWWAEERPAIAEYIYLAPKTTQIDRVTGYGDPNFAYGYVAQTVEVEVDTKTGQLYVRRIICAIDVGKAINRQQVIGQIEGAIAQALGWSTCENFITREGQVLTPDLTTYLIPTAGDMPPQVESIVLEFPDPNGPWGARGMAEMPFIPLAPALAAALHDATGVWYDQLPFSAERVLHGLSDA
jgi:CO/xanthine dehydrogenase Mo-binding subunit